MVMLVEMIDDMDVLYGTELLESEADHEAAFNTNWLQDLADAGHVIDCDGLDSQAKVT